MRFSVFKTHRNLNWKKKRNSHINTSGSGFFQAFFRWVRIALCQLYLAFAHVSSAGSAAWPRKWQLCAFNFITRTISFDLRSTRNFGSTRAKTKAKSSALPTKRANRKRPSNWCTCPLPDVLFHHLVCPTFLLFFRPFLSVDVTFVFDRIKKVTFLPEILQNFYG